eukprot:1137711-Rhodomonas_salina.1
MQARRRDGGSGSEVAGGSAAAGSAEAESAASGETPIIIDDRVEGEGVSTADDDYATKSENEAMPPDSSTDSDALVAEPLAKELAERTSNVTVRIAVEARAIPIAQQEHRPPILAIHQVFALKSNTHTVNRC